QQGHRLQPALLHLLPVFLVGHRCGLTPPGAVVPRLSYQSSMPSCSFAASDMRSLSQGGSHTTATSAAFTFASLRMRAFTSPGSEPATGQAGEVSVIWIATAPLGCTSMP